MYGWYIYTIILLVINVAAIKFVVSWLVEPIGWKTAVIIAIILTGIGVVAGMFLSPLLLAGMPTV